MKSGCKWERITFNLPILTFPRILKPDGIVEFIEIDPRPRFPVGCKRGEIEKPVKQKSGPQTDMEDRFKDPFDAELATNVPGWSKRVEERQKAILRPLREGEGVAAANLKSWLQGAGYVSSYIL